MSAGPNPGGRLAVRILEDRNLPASIVNRNCALRIAQENDASWAFAAPRASSLAWDQEQQFEMLVFNPLGPLTLTLSHPVEGASTCAVGPALARLDLPLFNFANSEQTEWFQLISVTTNAIIGEIRLELQYKCTPAWAELYSGLKLHHNGEYESAIKHLSRALNLGKVFEDDTVLSLRTTRSAAHLAQRQYDEALDDAEAAVQVNPNAVEGYLQRALIFTQTGLLDEAMQAITTGLEVNDDSVQLLELQRAIRSDLAKGPPSADAIQGREDYEKRDFRAAIDSFSRAIAQQPTNALTLVNRAFSHLAAGQLLEAHADILKAGQMNPAWVFEQPITKQGVVRKSGSWNLVLRHRYFVLKYNFLFYFPNPPTVDGTATATPLPPNGVILVQRGKTEVVQKRGENRKHIEITGLTSRVYHLKCANESEGDEWRTTLQSVPSEFPLPENRTEMKARWRPGARGSRAAPRAGEVAPVFLHSSVISGYLMIKGKRQPKKWWAVVIETDPTLYLFAQKPLRTDGPVQPDKAIPLPATRIATSTLTDLQLTTAKKTYTVQFSSEADLRPWMQALQSSAQALSTGGASSSSALRPVHSPTQPTVSATEERIFRSYGL